MKIVEATMIMPITCLILISLICLMMSFYTRLVTQTETHDEERLNIYKTKEVDIIRAYDFIKSKAE